MADMHLTRELLGAIARGEIPGRVLEDTMLEHLKSLCPHCKRELEEFAQEREAEIRGNRTTRSAPCASSPRRRSARS